MQRTPFVLQGNASLARAYRLFRTMGLHHLYIGPPKPQVIGLLTRKVCHSPGTALDLLKRGPIPARLRSLTVSSFGHPCTCSAYIACWAETTCIVPMGGRRALSSHHV